MIGSLRGCLLHRGDGTVIVEVSGVGYTVTVAPGTAVALGEVGHEVFVWIHHHVREDVEALYGFATHDERTTFDTLLGAHGVGPALALAILSVHAPAALAQAIAEEDIAALCLVPGVGKKTATRLLIELKSKLQLPEVDAVPSGSTLPGAAPSGAASLRADVRAALAGLGYSPDEIRTATTDLPPDANASALLRAALARLGAPG